MDRLGIWLIALALVFNAAVAYAQMELCEGPALVAQAQWDSVAPGAHVHRVAVDGMPGGPPSALARDHLGQGQGAHGHIKHSRLKCCPQCVLVSLLPKVAGVPVMLAYGEASFSLTQSDLVGRSVALDPHIPKSPV